MTRIPFQGQQSLKALLKTTSLLSEGEVETANGPTSFFFLSPFCPPANREASLRRESS